MAGKAKHPGPAQEIETERGLTEAQQLTLNAVRDYIDVHGIPPSFRDVMEIRRLASTSTIQAHFKHLRRAGAIDVRDGVPRSVRVLWAKPKRARRPDPDCPCPATSPVRNGASVRLWSG